jgi:hypothetical protein
MATTSKSTATPDALLGPDPSVHELKGIHAHAPYLSDTDLQARLDAASGQVTATVETLPPPNPAQQ